MRWIFFSLVLMNLLAFAWGMVNGPGQVPVQRASKAANPYASYPQLQLISELEQQPQALTVDKETPRGTPKVPSSDSSIVKALESQANVTESMPKKNSLSADPSKKLCEMVGPFESTNVAKNFIERLNAIDVKSELKELELPAGPGYWVYLKPQKTRREALRLLKELQAKRIDSYVIPKGELANGISLGMFSKKSLADARMNEMQSIGLIPDLEEIERTYRELWVMLAVGEGLKMSELSWDRAMDGINLLERRQNYCLSVASEEKFL